MIKYIGAYSTWLMSFKLLPTAPLTRSLGIWTPFKLQLTIFQKIARVPRRLRTVVKLVMAGRMPSQPRAPKSATNSGPSSRSATPKPYSFDKPANDHTISFRPRLSQKEYPPDCPPLNVRWYYAVDVGST